MNEIRNRIYGLQYMHCIFFLPFPPVSRMVASMSAPIEFVRRIGPDPHAGGVRTIALRGCPDIWELSNGDFAVIGIDITESANLPPTAGCGSDERIVRIPRNLLVNAKRDIPNQV